MSTRGQSLKNPSLLLTPHPSFKCGETIHDGNEDEYDSDDEELGRVKFSCNIPNNAKSTSDSVSVTTLHFRCRNQSVGFLLSDETSAKNDQEKLDSVQEAMDPNFFDTGYTLAGRTGFQIWAGSRVMMEGILRWPKSSSSPSPSSPPLPQSNKLVGSEDANNRLERYQQSILDGARILELGSGVGVVGTSLAAVGGQVLMTDLPTLVDYSLWPNLVANQVENEDESLTERQSPSWLGAETARIHQGWASTTALDWTKPVQGQLSVEQVDSIDIIISCDCVWLVSMLDGLLNSVASVFDASKSDDITFLMSFQRRDTGESDEKSMFTTVDKVLDSVESRGWKLQCLAWRPVTVKGEDDWKKETEVYIFEIKP